jgi:hypothetical protein
MRPVGCDAKGRNKEGAVQYAASQAVVVSMGTMVGIGHLRTCKVLLFFERKQVPLKRLPSVQLFARQAQMQNLLARSVAG